MLVERLILSPEIRDLNPVHFFILETFSSISIEKTNLRNRGKGEVVVAQLVGRSLPIPEVCGSNPVIGKIYMYYQLY